MKIDLNPIIAREFYTRWRGRNSFLLVFGYTALIAISIGIAYGSVVTSPGNTTSLSRLAEAGRNLFLVSTVMQSLAWMLLAPTLTATSIAGERERGLLEGLQLSPLTPWKIVWGKLLSSLTFALLIIAVSLPVTAVAFLLGGVSPGEFCIALVLHLVAAITGASFGLLCSAWSWRGNIALRTTIIFVFVWVVSSSIGLTTGIAMTTRIGTGSVSPGWLLLALFLGLSNPLVVSLSLITDGSRNVINSIAGIDAPVWLLSIGVQLILSAIFLWLATRALRRPFAEQYWIERSRSTPGQGMGNAAVTSHDNELVKQAVARMWWEIPLVAHLSFTNPVLQREVRGKFRMRQAPLWAIVFEGLLGLVVLYWYLRTLWAALFVPSERETIWWVLAFVALFVVMLSTAVMGASAFTREREIATWEALNQSLLTPWEIIRGKFVAPLLACLVYSIPLWPLLLPCIRSVSEDVNSSPRGLALTQALATVLIIGTTAWCYTAFGMLCSWRARSTSTAVGATIGLIFMSLTFVPLLSGLITYRAYDLVFLYHPIVAMSRLAGPYTGLSFAATGMSAVLYGLGWVFLGMLQKSICSNRRERDGAAHHLIAPATNTTGAVGEVPG